MEEVNRATITALKHALENYQWSAVKKHLADVQTKLPPQATATEIARALDTVREVADAFAETCSFTTAFETAYNSRRGLLRAGACEWAVATLEGFRVFVPVIARVATVLGLLGTGVDERCHVGSSGAVDLLTTLWHNNSQCLEIVSALGSLCAGHIDNVSRTMRQKGLVVAMKILKDPECLDNHVLIQRTLLYVGLCAICTPDDRQEGTEMVPVLIDVLERLTEAGLPHVAEHAISALGNISDCWMKEEYGYAITDHRRLIAAIVNSWSAFPRSRKMASVASRTLLAFFFSHVGAREAILAESGALSNNIDGCRQRTTTLQALHDIIPGRKQAGTSAMEKAATEPPSMQLGTGADTSPDDDTDEGDVLIHMAQKRHRPAHNNIKVHLLHETPPASPRLTRSRKTPIRDGAIVPSIAKRRRGRPKGSRKAVASSTADGDTTPVRATIGRGRPKRSPSAPETPSRIARVAPIAGPEVIDLCSDGDEDTNSPVALREFAHRRVLRK